MGWRWNPQPEFVMNQCLSTVRGSLEHTWVFHLSDRYLGSERPWPLHYTRLIGQCVWSEHARALLSPNLEGRPLLLVWAKPVSLLVIHSMSWPSEYWILLILTSVVNNDDPWKWHYWRSLACLVSSSPLLQPLGSILTLSRHLER